MKNKETLEEAAEILKGKELFKESNDRARKILSEIKSLPKQETLEEKLDKIVSKEPSKFWVESDERFKNKETLKEASIINYKKLYEGEPLTQDVPIDAFIQGAKYQQERSYTDEDMKSFADWCRNGLLNTEFSVDRLNEHLEQWKQFKKK